MPKRQQRMHLEMNQELHPPHPHHERTDINLHSDQRSHRPDPHRERKRMRAAMHGLEGGGFDPVAAQLLDEIA